MVTFHLHICDGDVMLADAGWIDVASLTTATGVAMLMARELKEDARFTRARVVVQDESLAVLANIPIADQDTPPAPHLTT